MNTKNNAVEQLEKSRFLEHKIENNIATNKGGNGAKRTTYK